MNNQQSKTHEFEVKVVYSVTELAELTGLSRFTMHRWLKRERVHTIRIGRKILVPFLSFRAAFPEVWEACTKPRAWSGPSMRATAAGSTHENCTLEGSLNHSFPAQH
jgi:excisionase family DNA binding protein